MIDAQIARRASKRSRIGHCENLAEIVPLDTNHLFDHSMDIIWTDRNLQTRRAGTSGFIGLAQHW